MLNNISQNTINLLKQVNIDKEKIHPLFLTSDIDSINAHQPLINLLAEFTKENIYIPLFFLGYSTNLIQYKHFNQCLVEDQDDLNTQISSLINFINSNNINRIVFWNTHPKIKLSLTKYLSHIIDFIDVSPGNYGIKEINKEYSFQKVIDYSSKNYFSDLFLFISQYTTLSDSLFDEYVANKLITIPNGMPYESYSRNDIFYKSSPFKFMIEEDISPKSNLELILYSFKRLISEFPDEHFVLNIYSKTGNKDEKYYQKIITNFNDIINKNVFFKDNKEHLKILPFHHGLISLTNDEITPNIVYEAAATHLPIIANDIGNTSYIINYDTGILLSQSPDVISLLNALVLFYSKYDEYIVKATNCYTKVRLNFSMTHMHMMYKEILLKK